MRTGMICGLGVLALAAIFAQGFAVFWFGGYGGSFLSVTGLQCVFFPALIEAVLCIVVAKNLDELQSRAISNPHSPLGRALRSEAAQPPAPPPTREAWTGGFEDMDEASRNMAKER